MRNIANQTVRAELAQDVANIIMSKYPKGYLKNLDVMVQKDKNTKFEELTPNTDFPETARVIVIMDMNKKVWE